LAGDPNTIFVANAYALLLNRVPDSGASFWVNGLNSGASPAGIVLGIEGSTEYLNDQVVAMYRHYLRRSPDQAGAQFWESFVQAGGTWEQVGALLTGSQEYFILQGGTNDAFIKELYVDLMNRIPSGREVLNWETLLANGATRLGVSAAFFSSQEYRMFFVQIYYRRFLQRDADEFDLTAWVNALNAGATDQQVLAQIFGSAEGYQLWS
jgi:hypothetical protein